VREIHNIAVLEIGDHIEISLHLKLPGALSLSEAHAAASRVEASILEELPEVDAVQTHLEPLAEPSEGRTVLPGDIEAEAADVRRIVLEESGSEARELRFLRTEAGLVAFLTLGMDPSSPLEAAHARASAIEERVRREHPEIGDVIVHTEP